MEKERISIPSGTWTWQVTVPGGHTGPNTTESHPVGSSPAAMEDPDRKAASGSRILLLKDPQSPNDWMTRVLPPGTDPAKLERAGVESLARNADLRQVTGPGGEIWSVRRVPAPDSIKSGDASVDRAPLRIQASCAGDPPHLLELPEGKALGEMRREELLPLLDSAGGAA